MNGISTFLWFDDQALEAAQHYVSIFPNSRILGDAAYAENTPGEAGTVMTVSFQIDGRDFTALNGGPLYRFTPAISFPVSCADQAEVDYFWERLTEGGGEGGQCGWLTDRFGVSWQVVPEALFGYIGGPDPDGAARAMQAMLGMGKLDIEVLRTAYEGS
ncbi:MAG: VOC family protein [Actinobacteria bacterium]|jgi:predicted 3-demethylubiquinone-9 3-methyltransferase (glyoxalase superfamily)|nr:VOC family protein [Actinomycetota bacterium]